MNGEARPTTEKGPWGPWATVGFTILVGATLFVVQSAVGIAYLIATIAASPKVDIRAAALALQTDGLFLSLAGIVGGSAALGVTLLVVWLRKGPSFAAYFALHRVTGGTALVWLGYTALLGIIVDGISYATGHPIVPVWVLSIYRSATVVPLILVALLVMAPLLEEMVFRGFFLEGLRHSWLGDRGSVVLASALWASTHLQYDLFYLGQIFLLGLLLGAARLRTGSLIPPILMHALFSAIAITEAALQGSK